MAIDQWAQDVQSKGLSVDYNPDGSAAGRADYISGAQVDFAMSDVAFRDGHDKLGDVGREVVPWGYSYIPGTAGAVAFPYHLSVHGREITNLRLSASTLVGIFTGKITNWDSAQITRDNGRQLPNLRITPVIHSDAAGTTFYFTRWMARMFPGQWNAFCARVTGGRVKPPCGRPCRVTSSRPACCRPATSPATSPCRRYPHATGCPSEGSLRAAPVPF